MLDIRPICGVMAIKALFRMSKISSFTSLVISCAVAQSFHAKDVNRRKHLTMAMLAKAHDARRLTQVFQVFSRQVVDLREVGQLVGVDSKAFQLAAR